MGIRWKVGLAAAAVLASALGAGVASAQPEPIEITCNGVQYTITTGNGNWSAAISTDKQTKFIPKTFTFSYEARDAEGNVIESGENEVDSKGNGNAHKNQETLTCTFGESGTDPDGTTWWFEGIAEVVRKG